MIRLSYCIIHVYSFKLPFNSMVFYIIYAASLITFLNILRSQQGTVSCMKNTYLFFLPNMSVPLNFSCSTHITFISAQNKTESHQSVVFVNVLQLISFLNIPSSGFYSGERIDASMKCAIIWVDWPYFGYSRFLKFLSFLV